MKSLLITTCAYLLLAVLPCLAAPSPHQEQLSLEAVQVVSQPRQATVFFRVRQGGKQVGLLKKEQIKVFAGNQELPLKSFEPQAKSPVYHAILLDRSGSMTARPLQEAKNATHLLLNAMPQGDKVAVFAFSDTLQPLTSFDAPRNQALAAINDLKTDGRRTELNFAIYSLIEKLESQRLPGAVSIIILSDGKDEGSSYTLDNTADKAKAASILLSGVGSSQINRKYLLSLEKLSRFTGGYYAESGGVITSQADAVKIIEHFSNRAELTVSLDTLPAGSATHNASLSVEAHGKTATAPLVVKMYAQSVVVPKPWYSRWEFVGSLAILLLCAGGVVIYLTNRKKPVSNPCPSCGNEREAPDSSCDCGFGQPAPEPPQWGILQGNCPELAGCQFKLHKPSYSIGSSSSSEIMLPVSTVSRTHASIHIKDGKAFLVDLKSKNGTKVNEVQVTDAELTNGSAIQLGSARLTFFFKGR